MLTHRHVWRKLLLLSVSIGFMVCSNVDAANKVPKDKEKNKKEAFKKKAQVAKAVQAAQTVGEEKDQQAENLSSASQDSADAPGGAQGAEQVGGQGGEQLAAEPEAQGAEQGGDQGEAGPAPDFLSGNSSGNEAQNPPAPEEKAAAPAPTPAPAPATKVAPASKAASAQQPKAKAKPQPVDIKEAAQGAQPQARPQARPVAKPTPLAKPAPAAQLPEEDPQLSDEDIKEADEDRGEAIREDKLITVEDIEKALKKLSVESNSDDEKEPEDKEEKVELKDLKNFSPTYLQYLLNQLEYFKAEDYLRKTLYTKNGAAALGFITDDVFKKQQGKNIAHILSICYIVKNAIRAIKKDSALSAELTNQLALAYLLLLTRAMIDITLFYSYVNLGSHLDADIFAIFTEFKKFYNDIKDTISSMDYKQIVNQLIAYYANREMGDFPESRWVMQFRPGKQYIFGAIDLALDFGKAVASEHLLSYTKTKFQNKRKLYRFFTTLKIVKQLLKYKDWKDLDDNLIFNANSVELRKNSFFAQKPEKQTLQNYSLAEIIKSIQV